MTGGEGEAGLVVRTVDRAPLSLLDDFARVGVATVGEVRRGAGVLAGRIRPIYAGAHVAGSAITVRVPPGDNWMIHVAVELCQDGDVLVVAPTKPARAGYFGELLATSARARGVRALVIDAGCRDVAELTGMSFPVWSRYVSPLGTVKEQLGTVNLPVRCGGQVVHGGDVVVADDDGVVIVPRASAATVLEQATARDAKELLSRARYQAGELSLDVHEMRHRLAERGLRYVDQPDGGWSDHEQRQG